MATPYQDRKLNDPTPNVGDAPYFITLGPHAFYWFALEPVGRLGTWLRNRVVETECTAQQLALWSQHTTEVIRAVELRLPRLRCVLVDDRSGLFDLGDGFVDDDRCGLLDFDDRFLDWWRWRLEFRDEGDLIEQLR